MTARLSHLGDQPNSKSAQSMHPRKPSFLFVGHVVSFCEGQCRYWTYKQNCIAPCLSLVAMLDVVFVHFGIVTDYYDL